MELPNLAHQPWPRFGLNWGTEPSPAGLDLGDPASPSSSAAQPGLMPVLSITNIAFGVRYNTGTINTAYPIAVRVASQGFVVPIGLLSASLSSSMVNATSDSTLAVLIARDVGPQISLSGSSDILVIHFCEQGLSHSMRSGVGFADDLAPKYGSGQNIALYICAYGTGYANNLVSVEAILRYFPLPV